MSINRDTHVYAVPGKPWIIDTINADTGLTRICGHTEADVLADEPLAVRISWEDWQQARSIDQRTPIVWSATSAKTYRYMLDVLPPALWIGGAFLVGEPTDHDALTGQPRFAAYWMRGSSPDFNYYLSASRPLTCAELRAEVERRS